MSAAPSYGAILHPLSTGRSEELGLGLGSPTLRILKVGAHSVRPLFLSLRYPETSASLAGPKARRTNSLDESSFSRWLEDDFPCRLSGAYTRWRWQIQHQILTVLPAQPRPRSVDGRDGVTEDPALPRSNLFEYAGGANH